MQYTHIDPNMPAFDMPQESTYIGLTPRHIEASVRLAEAHHRILHDDVFQFGIECKSHRDLLFSTMHEWFQENARCA